MKQNNAKLLLTALFLSIGSLVYAQPANTSGTQTANLELSNSLDIVLLSSSSTTMSFTSINDMLNGVESGTQELMVRSNKDFKVSVAASSNNFTYTGSSIINNILSVSSVLKVRVVSNNTGGTVPFLMWLLGYQSIPGTGGMTILNNCNSGGNQTFSVKYKATPGVMNAGGNYSVDIIYTATQI